ncbi:hypothetical protein DBR06_SOUSAS38810002, partial [Sousa chinensis]
CNACVEGFSDLAQILLSQKRIHGAKKAYACNECGKGF